jgi:hypothetical protein
MVKRTASSAEHEAATVKRHKMCGLSLSDLPRDVLEHIFLMLEIGEPTLESMRDQFALRSTSKAFRSAGGAAIRTIPITQRNASTPAPASLLRSLMRLDTLYLVLIPEETVGCLSRLYPTIRSIWWDCCEGSDIVTLSESHFSLRGGQMYVEAGEWKVAAALIDEGRVLPDVMVRFMTCDDAEVERDMRCNPSLIQSLLARTNKLLLWGGCEDLPLEPMPNFQRVEITDYAPGADKFLRRLLHAHINELEIDISCLGRLRSSGLDFSFCEGGHPAASYQAEIKKFFSLLPESQPVRELCIDGVEDVADLFLSEEFTSYLSRRKTPLTLHLWPMEGLPALLTGVKHTAAAIHVMVHCPKQLAQGEHEEWSKLSGCVHGLKVDFRYYRTARGEITVGSM